MFVPFVLDAIVAYPQDDFSSPEIREAVSRRSGLDIPDACLSTILNRIRRKEYLRREGGRYFRVTQKLPSTDVFVARKQIEKEHAELGRSLRDFAAKKKVSFDTDEQATEALVSFVATYQVPLLLDAQPNQVIAAGKTIHGREARAVASFIRESCGVPESPSKASLQRLVEGMILHNALFLTDFGNIGRKFRNLKIYLDTRVLLHLLGLTDHPIVNATREAIELLRDANARLAVFDTTLREVRGILNVYEYRLRTLEGMRSLLPTELTRYFLIRRSSPADVRQISASLEQTVRDIGLAVEGIPDHVAAYTLDERTLADSIKGQDDESSDRVKHDVDCVSAVLTRRRGGAYSSLDDAKAVFATATPRLVGSVARWYRDNKGAGIPPVVHFNALSSVAWLKDPTRSKKSIKLNELVAACYVALRPNEEVWDKFMNHLRQLEAAGEINSQEAVAVAANEMTYDVLSDLDTPDDLDATTVSEVVARVKNELSDGLAERLASAARCLDESEQRETRLRAGVRTKADNISQWAAGAAFWIVSALLVGGIFTSLFTTVGFNSWTAVCLIILSCVSAWNLLYGTTVTQWQASLHQWIRPRLSRFLLGDESSQVEKAQ